MIVYGSGQRHMAPKSSSRSRKSSQSRPEVARPSPFAHDTKPEDSDETKPLNRAKTFPEVLPNSTSPGKIVEDRSAPDVFETTEQADIPEAIEITRPSIDLDDLPIELLTLIDG